MSEVAVFFFFSLTLFDKFPCSVSVSLFAVKPAKPVYGFFQRSARAPIFQDSAEEGSEKG